MERLKKMLRKIFCLPPIPTLLISIPSYGLVIYALADENAEPTIAYIAYFLSAYAFILTVTGITGIVRFVRRGINQHPLVRKAMGIPMVSRYIREEVFRAEAGLYQGFFINLLYAGIKMISGILYSSVWFVTLAVYYILLAVMRASLLHYVRKTGKDYVPQSGKDYVPQGGKDHVLQSGKDHAPQSGKDHVLQIVKDYVPQTGQDKAAEWKRYRLCGVILLLMNVTLAGIVVLVVHQNSGFAYPGMLIYVMAIYAFYAAITAVRNVVKFRRYGSPVMSAAKVINLTAALVSMLSLETAMLTQFGAADDPMFRQIMTASTGAGICIIVVGMAIFMLLRSTKQLRHKKARNIKKQET